MPQQSSAWWSRESWPLIGRAGTVLASVVFLMALAACVPSRVSDQPPPGQVPQLPSGGMIPMTPPGERVQVGLLLPLSGDFAGWGQAWLNAAELALFEAPDSNVALIIRDTAGSPAVAAQAARDVIQKGAAFILGPGLGSELQGVAPVARSAGVNVVSFSTDKTAAGEGVFVMGILPGLQIERVVGYAGRQGLRQFAALAPQSRYGQIVATSLRDAARRVGGSVARTEFYDPNMRDSSAAIGQIGHYVGGGGRVDALLIPEGGDRLRGIAARLGEHGIDTTQVRLLGSTLWGNSNIAADPALVGGWFPAPDPDPWRAFEGRYRAAFGSDPPRFATIAYDATLLAVLLAGEPGGADFTTTALTAPAGFSGIDGIFRFLPDGTVERGLAIMEVRENRVDMREPAPLSFDEVIY